MFNDQNSKKLIRQETKMKPKRPRITPQINNPLHGVTLADILEYLVENLGWEEMGNHIKINCFHSNPSIKSSLRFLRKTEWARKKVEQLYLRSID